MVTMHNDQVHQLTVNSLREILNEISYEGYGDMPIFLGRDTPLMDDSISYDLYDGRMMFRNTYYDEQMVDAAARFKNDIDVAIKRYILNCCEAGRLSTKD